MSFLELRVPPPIVALLVAAGMWGLTLVSPASSPPSLYVGTALGLAVVGVSFSVAGALAFRKAGTTKNPMKPQAASSLVVTGVYRATRNPMYVGLSVLLLAWAVYLWSLWVLVGLLVFIAYISRFQIAPEERALAELFGSEYSAYTSRVRRWL
jgi:protein-S-isoprenylcysteine O-methyltransferase Ste14